MTTTTTVINDQIRFSNDTGASLGVNGAIGGTGEDNTLTLLDTLFGTTSQVVLQNVGTPVAGTDAVNKTYADTLTTDAAGADTQVQYNDGGTSFGADAGFTYNKTETTPIMSLGSTATGNTTLNMGNGANSTIINMDSTGSNSLVSDGQMTVSGETGLTLAALTSGNVVVDTASNDWTFNGTSLTSDAAANVVSTSADLTLQAATSGNIVVDTASNDWTFNGTSLTSDAAANVVSTSADLTLQAATSGNVVVDTATNDWTFNGTSLTSEASATIEATSSDLTLSTTEIGGIVIDAGDNTTVAASDLTGTTMEIQSQTLTATSSLSDLVFTGLSQPSILAGANTVTNAATMYIADAPGVGSGTVTNSYALWVDSGKVRMDGVLEVDTIESNDSVSVVNLYNDDALTTLNFAGAMTPGGNVNMATGMTTGTINIGTSMSTGTINMGSSGTSAEIVYPRTDFSAAGSTAMVNKGYVDSVAAGLQWKESATASTQSGDMAASTYTASPGDGLDTIAWVGVPTIDGVSVVVNDRVLVKEDAATNGTNSQGIYIVTSITGNLEMQRTTDALGAGGPAIAATGAAIFIEEGSTDSDKAFVCDTDDADFGDDITFTVFSSSGSASGPEDSIQFNTAGNFTGVSTFTYDNSTTTATILNIGSDISTATTAATFNLGTGSSGASVDATFNLSDGTGSTIIDHQGSGSLTFQNSSATNNTIMKLGDAAGVTSLVVQDSGNVVQFDVNSDGSFFSLGNADIRGGTIQNSTGNLILDAPGDASTLSLSSGNATTAATSGGEIDITAGDGNTSGNGGLIDINAGAAGDTGIGGEINISAGIGGATSGAGGSINMSAGSGAGTDADGGNVTVTTGTRTGTGTDGIFTILQNSGALGASSFVFDPTGVVGFPTMSFGLEDGGAFLKAVDATTLNSTGSGMISFAGDGNGTGSGGNFQTIAGAGGATGDGGGSTITGGAGGSTSGAGGSVDIKGGNATSGNGGNVTLETGIGSTSGNLIFQVDGVSSIWPTADSGGSGYVLTKSSGVDQMSWTSPGAATMLGLPQYQLYVGDASNVASVGTTNLQYDDTTTPGAPILKLGDTATGTTTLNLGTGVQGSTIASVGSGTFSILSAPTASVQLFPATVSGNITMAPVLTGNLELGNSTSSTTSINGSTVTLNAGSSPYIFDPIGFLASLPQFTHGTEGSISVIKSVDATTIATDGCASTIASGNGNTSGNGGDITVGAGLGGATDGSSGGNVDIESGSSSATNGDAGSINITGGNGTGTGTGGNVEINAGSGGTDGNTVLKFASATGGTIDGSSTTNIIDIQTSAGSSVAHVERDGKFYAPAFQTSSDMNYKTNINKLDDPLSRLRKIEGYSYNLKEHLPIADGYEHWGLLAQQLENSGCDHLVRGVEGSKTVNYQGLIPLLVEALKESDKQVQTLTLGYGQMLQNLQEQIEDLKNDNLRQRLSRRGL